MRGQVEAIEPTRQATKPPPCATGCCADDIEDVTQLSLSSVTDEDDYPSWSLSGLTITTSGRMFAHEYTGDGDYEMVWTRELRYTDRQIVNANALVYAGDLDGDGRNEFLVGGLKTVPQVGLPRISVVYLLESVGDDDVEVIATFVDPLASEEHTSVAVADVDGDGRQEIVIGTGTEVRIFRNVGDDAWDQIWSASVAYFFNQRIGAGDHDGDGKAEIILQTTSTTAGIFEIDPADVADVDSDGIVDAIDNCLSASNPGQEDTDLDGVGDACDNCAFVSNGDQGPAAFGQTILATDSTNFI